MTQEVDWHTRALRFQQRIAELVTQYETDIMLLREQYDNRISELMKDSKGEVVSTDSA